MLFQSTLPSQGATAEGLKIRADLLISIHAPLTGSDETSFLISVVLLISIHAPLTGSDPANLHCQRYPIEFQSTLPSQGATNTRGRSGRNSHFNPRSPHRERPTPGSRLTQAWTFQSTLPSQGATVDGWQTARHHRFQSTLPSQGATGRPLSYFAGRPDFNPRSPHRERQRFAIISASLSNFNPRSPHRERLRRRILLFSMIGISIHAPLTGSDHLSTQVPNGPKISIHAPLTGSDLYKHCRRFCPM